MFTGFFFVVLRCAATGGVLGFAVFKNKWSEPVSLEGGNCGNGGLAPRSFSYLCVAAASLVCSSAARDSSVSSVSMVVLAGSLPVSSATPGGSLTGWGGALALLPSAALPRRWELLGFGSAAFPSKLMRVWCLAKAGGRGAWFCDRFAGRHFIGCALGGRQAEASDLQPLHSRPAEDHNVPTIADVSKFISKHCLKLTRFDAA